MSTIDAGSVPTLLDFDFTSDEQLLDDLWSRWDELRDGYRFFRADFGPDPIWVMTRYEDIHEALHDPGLFSSAAVSVIDPVGAHRWNPEELDPPEHGKYRQLLTPFFSPGAVKQLEPRIRQWCRDLVDGFAGEGRCDFVDGFARLFPTIIFMGLMGLPVERAEAMLDWAHELMHTQPGDDADGLIRGGATQNIMGLLMGLVADRRQEPRDDLVSTLVQAHIDGEPIADGELLQMLFLLYMAGLDTVAGELGAMFRHLAQHPDDRRRIADDPATIPLAVEELLRAYSIVSTGRLVTRDVDWHGCPMKQGHRVLLPTPAADRDPAEFPDAATVRLDRTHNRHMAFGAGPHRCLGSYLARAELTIALEEWHTRIPDYRIEDPSLVRLHSGGVAGFDHLPLVWEVSERGERTGDAAPCA
jgi:cytochrome P450